MSIRTVFAAAALMLSCLCASAQDKMIYPLKAQSTLVGARAVTLSDLSSYNNHDSFGGYGHRTNANAFVDQSYIPCNDIYPAWVNQYVRYGNVDKPAQFKIDLSGYCNPVKSRAVSSHYGYRPAFGRNHYGTDISLNTGDTIRSAWRGRVRIVSYEAKGYGNFVVVRHENGLETVYGHMSRHLCQANDWVEAGQPIGLGGSTGRSTGPHLHFETRFLGENIDPEILLNFTSHQVKGDYYVYRNGMQGTLMGGAHNANAPLLAYNTNRSAVVSSHRSTKQAEAQSSKASKKEAKKEVVKETKKEVAKETRKEAVKEVAAKKAEPEVVFTSEPSRKKDVAKAETKATNSKTKVAEKDVAKAETKATSSKTKVAEKDVAKAETKTASSKTKVAEKDVAKAETKTANSKTKVAEKDVAKAETKATSTKSKASESASASNQKDLAKADQKGASKGSYTVKKGETLYSIAKANNTTVEMLCKKNHISDAALIKEGQTIRTM